MSEDKALAGVLGTWLTAGILVVGIQLNGATEPHCFGDACCCDALSHSSHVFGTISGCSFEKHNNVDIERISTDERSNINLQE